MRGTESMEGVGCVDGTKRADCKFGDDQSGGNPATDEADRHLFL